MNFLAASLDVDGRIVYFENDEIKWEFPLNCSKFLETDGKYYYAFSQGSPVKLYSFVKNGDQFEVRDTLEIDDITVSHLKYNHKFDVLFCSCMDSGYYYAIKMEDGCFKKILIRQLAGVDEFTRCHQVIFDKTEEFCVIINIKHNFIMFNKFDGETMTELYRMNFELNEGPRHVMFSKSEKYLYLITERSNEIMVLDYKNQTIVSRVPIVENPKEGSKALTFGMDKDLTKLFVGLRGNDTMTEFNILEDETLSEAVCVFETYGHNARHTVMTSDFKYIVNVNIDTNNITFIDPTTKALVKELEFGHACSIIEVL